MTKTQVSDIFRGERNPPSQCKWKQSAAAGHLLFSVNQIRVWLYFWAFFWPFFSSQSHIFDWEISDWKNWWFQPFDEKFHLKKDKKSAPHSPQKKRRPKRENGIDVFEIRRRRKEREKKGETICGARSQRGRLKTSENFFLRLHQRFFLLLPEKKMLRFFFFVPLYFIFYLFNLTQMIYLSVYRLCIKYSTFRVLDNRGRLYGAVERYGRNHWVGAVDSFLLKHTK